MSSALQFFNTPELVLLMVQHLDKADISHLSRTNRHLHLWTKPLLYKDITAIFDPKRINIFASPASMAALARNVLSVRSLHVGLAEAVYLHNRLRDFDQESLRVSPRDAARSPLTIPMPPMGKLKELEMTLSPGRHDKSCPYFLPKATFATVEQSGKMLQMSEHLVKIKVRGVHVWDQQDLNSLARILAGVPRLEVLELIARTKIGGQRARTWWFNLFFACQPLIRKFNVDLLIEGWSVFAYNVRDDGDGQSAEG
ncbi:hypothetical protein BGX23_003999 [Mortierella sp. AD031]|nr:hypothetical protein BGX23_003999 [Mortierella sp. AD031]KAG0220013.1 hypothetical protein BGX33_010588 [Mortierella sp. NVP41]